MRRFTTLLLTALLLLSLVACGAKDAWQEQYDLGMRYLNDGNYEEAVIAFTAAIEIDPKRPEAYLGAAEAYRGMGDADSARKILEQGYAATNDSSLAPSYEAPQIGELYSEDFDYTDSVGNSGHYTYHVPQITADTQGAAAINRAIEDVYGPIVREELESVSGGSSLFYLSITWETYQYDNILSLVVYCYVDMDANFYNVYLYDIAGGRQLTTADLLAALGMDETAFLDAVRQAAAERFDGQYRDLPADADAYLAERREWTLSDENINMDVAAYADDAGKLYVVLPIGSIAGASAYEQILTLDTVN